MRSDEFAILSRPRATPSWKAEGGLLVPVYANSDEERMERERDALVWRLQTFGGALPSRNARDAYDLEPCLDPTLHDQRTNLDPDTAEYGQSYPDGHDDVTTGAA